MWSRGKKRLARAGRTDVVGALEGALPVKVAHLLGAVPREAHRLGAGGAARRLRLLTGVAPVDQHREDIPHQRPPLLPGFLLDVRKTGIRMLVVPVFKLLKHLRRVFEKGRFALLAG